MRLWGWLRNQTKVRIISGICIVMLCSSFFYPIELQAEEVEGQIAAEDIEKTDGEEAENLVPGDKEETETTEYENKENEVTQNQEIESDKTEEADNLDVIEDNKAEQREIRAAQWDIREKELILEYDDRYSLDELIEDESRAWAIAAVETKKITSKKVSQGQATAEADDQIVVSDEEEKAGITAVGVGEAEVLLVPEEQLEAAKDLLANPGNTVNSGEPINAVRVNVTVEPAALTLMYIMGQSNAEGWCSSNTGYDRSVSVACEEGKVYSTYAPSTSQSEKMAGLSFSAYCTEDNASDFVAGALRGDQSISGKNLEYSLDTLTEGKGGKTGLDSGLAYEWNRLTGDKVWVVNTAWGGTPISNWLPGKVYYNRSLAVNQLVMKTYQAEIEAGHYRAGKNLAVWLQGEANKQTESDEYYNSFQSVYNGMLGALGLDRFGVVMVRSDEGSRTNEDDISMSGPRIAPVSYTHLTLPTT